MANLNPARAPIATMDNSHAVWLCEAHAIWELVGCDRIQQTVFYSFKPSSECHMIAQKVNHMVCSQRLPRPFTSTVTMTMRITNNNAKKKLLYIRLVVCDEKVFLFPGKRRWCARERNNVPKPVEVVVKSSENGRTDIRRQISLAWSCS